MDLVDLLKPLANLYLAIWANNPEDPEGQIGIYCGKSLSPVDES